MDYTLKSGRALKIDVSQLTQKEWRDFVIPGRGDYKAEDAVIMKSTGLTIDELESLTQEEIKLLVFEIVKARKEYLSAPN